MANPPIDRAPVLARINHAFTRRNAFYSYHQGGGVAAASTG
jgi:hypothetical protein